MLIWIAHLRFPVTRAEKEMLPFLLPPALPCHRGGQYNSFRAKFCDFANGRNIEWLRNLTISMTMACIKKPKWNPPCSVATGKHEIEHFWLSTARLDAPI